MSNGYITVHNLKLHFFINGIINNKHPSGIVGEIKGKNTMKNAENGRLKILAVDDEPLILDLYERILSPASDGFGESPVVLDQISSNQSSISFDLTLCSDGNEAVEKVKSTIAQGEPMAIAFIDMRMSPGPDGLMTAEAIRSIDPYIQIVFVTGFSDINLQELASRVPPVDKLLYLQKPFQFQEIWQFASSLSAKWKVEQEFRKIQAELEDMVERRTFSLKEANKKKEKEIKARIQTEKTLNATLENLQKTMKGTIQAMANTVETRDPYTAGHQRRVACLARSIAEEIGLSEKQIEGVYMSGVIHDLGKISVPAEILAKPGRITETEFNLIKIHPQVGYDILKGIEFSWPIAMTMLQHHERMDGSGYPQGLQGEQIIEEARIVAVADVVEAMASHRPYRPALGIHIALEEIQKKKGTFFDRKVVDACLTLFNEKKYQIE